MIRLAARGESPATWNRCASVLLQREAHAARGARGTPFLPADPTRFATFLAESAVGARGNCVPGNTQSKQRACAIAALSGLGGAPSPVDDALVRDVRAGLRRTMTLLYGP